MLGGSPLDAIVGSPPTVQLGKYRLIRKLATGGMAELFLARATAIHGFEKLVVLKRILPQHAESEEFIRMFLAEARLAATLHHPNIVQVYDIGEQASTYFFTMEFVQGQDLRRLVRAARKADRPIPLEHILQIIMGVAAGLHHAHEKIGLDGRPLGIVHRDVSPSNVLVTYEGGVKIVDFGIAKAATAQTATIAGTLKGKIPYMSPEQCRGEQVDRRSDIFSIGTLLWELTTGARLFAGDNEFAILNRVAGGDVPLPSSIRPDYPPELEAIVMRSLQADRDNRYSSALDMQIDIEDFAREARLPVSSARLAKFMRELFSDEIEQMAAVLHADSVDEAQTVPQPVLSPSSSSVIPARISTDSVSDYTPSDPMAGSPGIAATPGPTSAGIHTNAGVDFDDEVPGRRSSTVVMAVLLTLVVVFVLAGGAYFLYGPDGGLWGGKAGQDANHVGRPQAPSTLPNRQDPSATPTKPQDKPAVVMPAVGRNDAGDSNDGKGDGHKTDGSKAEDDGEILLGDSERDASSTDESSEKHGAKDDRDAHDPAGEKDDKTTNSKRSGSKRSGGSRHSSSKKSPKKDTKKPKWDPKSPFLK